PEGEIWGTEPIVQLACRARRDAAASAGALRRALRAGVAQPFWRRGCNRRQLLPAAGLGRARGQVHEPLLAHLYRGGAAPPRGAAIERGAGRGDRSVARDRRRTLVRDELS